MDFGTLLHVAKKNSENNKNEGKYYSTKFAPPKKETKEKKLSDNIQKFLQKREQEEKQRKREQQEKVNSLLAMRDEKSKNRVKKMLKVTKSANKSVLDDAIDSEHTAVTMQGPEQCDADDYGYVSMEANAFYQKYIEKVKDVKEDKGFAPSRPQSLKDLSGTKERVKAAITRETEEKKSHTRQRSSATSTSTSHKDTGSSAAKVSTSSKPVYDPEAERREEERKKREEDQKRAKNRKPPPPPMDFQALLKLAEKKQHEPVVSLLPEIKKKEPERRLLTSKEKLEWEERQRAKEARERRQREGNAESSKNLRKEGGPSRMESNGRIPKLNNSSKSVNSPSATVASSKQASSAPTGKISENGARKSTATTSSASSTSSSKLATKATSQGAKQAPAATSSSSSSSLTKPSTHTSAASINKTSTNSKNPYSGPTRAFPPKDQKPVKSRPFPPPDMQKTRQFPPADVRRDKGAARPGDNKRPQAPKRRIFDDDDEDDYDSDLDDFIDDGDCDMDYSSHIKAIFGYDKSKYRDIDVDDSAMESNFAQVQREEYISKKIGMREDLEDMKQEAIDKKRKMMKKKQRLDD